jgi:transcriptional regulator with XRE-family HTH domain
MAASTELGEFLRARRARLRPSEVGLPPGAGPRRTPGLRREELAAIAGLSIDYYIRLEQGKETNPSTAILNGLARALHLTEEEHEHLYTLANHAARRARPSSPHAIREVRAGARLLLETVRPCPAYVQNRVNDILAANPEALGLHLQANSARFRRVGVQKRTRATGQPNIQAQEVFACLNAATWTRAMVQYFPITDPLPPTRSEPPRTPL